MQCFGHYPTAGGSGVPQCCIIMLYGIVIDLLVLMNPSHSADWSCSTFLGLCSC